MAEKKRLQYSGDIRTIHMAVGLTNRHDGMREMLRSLCRGTDVFSALMNKVEHMVRQMPDYEANIGIMGFVFRLLPSCEPGKEMDYRLYVRSLRQREPALRFIPITFSARDGKVDTVGPEEPLQMPEMTMQALVNEFNRKRSAEQMDRIVAAAERENNRGA